MRFIPKMQDWFNIPKPSNITYNINTIKDQKKSSHDYLMIISLNAEKVFDKINHPVIIKTHIQRELPQPNKWQI